MTRVFQSNEHSKNDNFGYHIVDECTLRVQETSIFGQLLKRSRPHGALFKSLFCGNTQNGFNTLMPDMKLSQMCFTVQEIKSSLFTKMEKFDHLAQNRKECIFL